MAHCENETSSARTDSPEPEDNEEDDSYEVTQLPPVFVKVAAPENKESEFMALRHTGARGVERNHEKKQLESLAARGPTRNSRSATSKVFLIQRLQRESAGLPWEREGGREAVKKMDKGKGKGKANVEKVGFNPSFYVFEDSPSGPFCFCKQRRRLCRADHLPLVRSRHVHEGNKP